MIIGAHVSTRGGIHNAVDNALAIGADAFQVHPRSALQWRPLHLDDAVRTTYRQRYAASGLRGHYLHALYLVNLATGSDQLLRQSIGSLVHHMQVAEQLDADGVVLHPGSHLGAGFDGTLDQVGAALREVLDTVPNARAKLLVENSAGSGGCVGRTFEELGRIVGAVGSDRVGVCLDTQHMFASGYDVRTRARVRDTLDRFGAEVGFHRLALVHANDSRTPLGSNADRHANIGEGEMGLRGVPPAPRRRSPQRGAMDHRGARQGRRGPDLDNVNRLRACAGLPARVLAAPAGAR